MIYMSELAPLDRLDEQLRQLAPDVDETSAHRAFSAARRRATRRHRAALGGAGTAVAAVVLTLGALAVGQSEPSRVTAGPSVEQQLEAPNTFPLPASGTAKSVLLDDGMPVWVVNHGDGSASAVPALVPGAGPPAPITGDRVFSQVLWDPDGAFDVFAASGVPGKALSWDAHGRAITADADLGGYRATVRSEIVRVERVASHDVPGTAEPVHRSGDGIDQPQLPSLSPLRDLSAGWHQVDGDIVVDEAGNARLCEPADLTQPFGPDTTSACPLEATEVAPLALRSSATGEEIVQARMYSPVVVHVNERLVIDGVLPLGGVSAEQP